MAKLGLLLYVSGLLTSSLYYCRFSILTLDLAKTQCILIGVYLLLLYAIIPGGVLLAMKTVRRQGVVSLVLTASLGILDLIVARAVGYHSLGLARTVFFTAVLQFSLFLDVTNLWRALTRFKLLVAFEVPPSKPQALMVALLCCLQFSFSWFPQIPAYVGGGKPLSVQVFTRTPELPANRFIDSKNHPQINKSMDCFSLRLLYETSSDLYFVSDIDIGGNLASYSVMRLDRGEVIRIDYNTPKWVEWRGAK